MAAISVAALVAVFAGTVWAHGGSMFSPIAKWSGYRQDFTAPYAAAQMIVSGSPHQIYNVSAVAGVEARLAGSPVGGTGVLAYFNPPFFAFMLTPLTVLSLEHAYQVWTASNLVLLAADLWMVWRVASPLRRPLRIVLALGFVTLAPVTYGLLLGQFSLILVTSWMAAFLLLRARHERWGGAARAPLLIKPELLLPVVLFLVLKRRWRALAILAPITVLAGALSVAVVGLTPALAYPGYLLRSTQWQGNGIASNVMFNWNGVVAMFWSQPTTVPVATVALALLSLATLTCVWHVWSGEIDTSSPRFALQWCVLTAATVLVDPTSTCRTLHCSRYPQWRSWRRLPHHNAASSLARFSRVGPYSSSVPIRTSIWV
jgi:hypothetical protein